MAKVKWDLPVEFSVYRDDDADLVYLNVSIGGGEQTLSAFKLGGVLDDMQEAQAARAQAAAQAQTSPPTPVATAPPA